MSWDIYIDNILGQSVDYVGVLHCDRACIIGLDGKAWTSHSHPNAIKLSPKEAAVIAEGMKGTNSQYFQEGVVAERITYQFIKKDGDAVISKRGLRFLTMQKSSLSVIIGLSIERGQQGYVSKAVSLVADYLQNKNL